MKRVSLLMALILAGGLGFGTTAIGAQKKQVETKVKKGVVKAWRLGNTNYCHLRFPPITPRTLFSGKPELADPEYVGLIDYYGPCDHDPLGEIEVDRQVDIITRDLYKSR